MMVLLMLKVGLWNVCFICVRVEVKWVVGFSSCVIGMWNILMVLVWFMVIMCDGDCYYVSMGVMRWLFVVSGIMGRVVSILMLVGLRFVFFLVLWSVVVMRLVFFGLVCLLGNDICLGCEDRVGVLCWSRMLRLCVIVVLIVGVGMWLSILNRMSMVVLCVLFGLVSGGIGMF